MPRDSIERKLRAVSDELRTVRSELSVIDEQIAHFAAVADDTRLRAMVSETPLADREHREASRTVAGLRRDREKWAERLVRLEAKQDDLLDELTSGG